MTPLPDALGCLISQIVLMSRLNSILQLRLGEIKLNISHHSYVQSHPITYFLSDITNIRRLNPQR